MEFHTKLNILAHYACPLRKDKKSFSNITTLYTNDILARAWLKHPHSVLTLMAIKTRSLASPAQFFLKNREKIYKKIQHTIYQEHASS